jgi:hypothetical protein
VAGADGVQFLLVDPPSGGEGGGGCRHWTRMARRRLRKRDESEGLAGQQALGGEGVGEFAWADPDAGVAGLPEALQLGGQIGLG